MHLKVFTKKVTYIQMWSPITSWYTDFLILRSKFLDTTKRLISRQIWMREPLSSSTLARQESLRMTMANTFLRLDPVVSRILVALFSWPKDTLKVNRCAEKMTYWVWCIQLYTWLMMNLTGTIFQKMNFINKESLADWRTSAALKRPKSLKNYFKKFGTISLTRSLTIIKFVSS